MARAYLGLGSNLGPRWALLGRAAEGLSRLGEHLMLSPVYETAPVGGPGGQGPFLNCVARLDTELSPRELLDASQALEAEAGRVRLERWGPRTLDVDVLFYDDLVLDEPDLMIPHPRTLLRAFVLAPLEDLAPELVDPHWRIRLGEDAAPSAIRRVGVLVRPTDAADEDSDEPAAGPTPARRESDEVRRVVGAS